VPHDSHVTHRPLGDFQTMFRELVKAMQATLNNQEKFNRFANAVIVDSDERGIGGTAQKEQLRAQLRQITNIRDEWNERNQGSTLSGDYGHGRLDALGAIFNETAATALGVEDNRKDADAPVSYPFVWDTPQHDKVQWNGSIPNAKLGSLSRNVGEVIGVFGALTLRKPRIIPPTFGHKTSVNVGALAKLESLLWKMQSPQWSDTTLTAFNEVLAKEGGEGHRLFKKFCHSCHETIDRTNVNRKIKAFMVPVINPDNSSDPNTVRTDITTASNFLEREAQARKLTDQYVRYSRILSEEEKFEREGQNDVKQIKIVAYSVAGTIIREFLEDPHAVIEALKAGRSQSTRQALHNAGETLLIELGALSLKDKIMLIRDFLNEYGDRYSDYDASVQTASSTPACFPDGTLACYKARSLNGIWATAPYLHNGSVRTMRDLLLPASMRQKKFKIGSREFDTKNIGFKDEGASEYDTSKPGNSNSGHDGPGYGSDIFASEPDKMNALLEYLKSL
jgi:hypothetical protein